MLLVKTHANYSGGARNKLKGKIMAKKINLTNIEENII